MKVSEGFSGVKSLLSHWATPRELPPQLTWKYGHETELLSWRIKARNYNTVIANGLFVFWLVVAVWFGFSVYSNFERYDEPMRSFVFFCIDGSCVEHDSSAHEFRLPLYSVWRRIL